MPLRSEHPAHVALLLGIVGALLFPMLDTTGLGDYWYFAVASVAVVIGLHGAGESTGDWRRFGLSGFLLAQVLGGVIQALSDDDGTFGAQISIADLLFVASYILAALGLHGWSARANPGLRHVGHLDAFILILGLCLVGWQFVLSPALTLSGLPFSLTHPSVLRMWYPIASFVLLAMLAWLAATQAVAGRRLALLRAGFAAWAVAETSFHLTTLSSAVPNWWTQTLWLLAYVLIGAALALPDVPEPPNRAARLDAEPADTSFLGIALLSVPMVLWRGLPQPANEESVLIVIAMALLAGLVWVRFSLLCRHMATVNAELVDLAYTDLASGARSRHYLDAALQVALADASEPAGTLYVLSLEIAEGLPGAEQDATLLALRRAMSSAAAAGDVVARVADHRFALLSRGASSPVARHTTAWRIQNELLGEITRQGMLLAGPPAVHIGTVVCAPAEGDARGLLDRATRRAERARREGVLVIGEDA